MLLKKIRKFFDNYITELAEGKKKGMEMEIATSIPEVEEEGGFG